MVVYAKELTMSDSDFNGVLAVVRRYEPNTSLTEGINDYTKDFHNVYNGEEFVYCRAFVGYDDDSPTAWAEELWRVFQNEDGTYLVARYAMPEQVYGTRMWITKAIGPEMQVINAAVDSFIRTVRNGGPAGPRLMPNHPRPEVPVPQDYGDW